MVYPTSVLRAHLTAGELENGTETLFINGQDEFPGGVRLGTHGLVVVGESATV